MEHLFHIFGGGFGSQIVILCLDACLFIRTWFNVKLTHHGVVSLNFSPSPRYRYGLKVPFQRVVGVNDTTDTMSNTMSNTMNIRFMTQMSSTGRCFFAKSLQIHVADPGQVTEGPGFVQVETVSPALANSLEARAQCDADHGLIEFDSITRN